MAQSAHIEEVPADDVNANESDGELDDAADDVLAPAEGSSSGAKKKKKKKSKLAKLQPSIPQPVLDEVLKRVRDQVGQDNPDATEANVREALDQMKLMDYVKGKAGIGGKNKKDMGEYKVRTACRALRYADRVVQFWKTQPVTQIGMLRPRRCFNPLTRRQARHRRRKTDSSSPHCRETKFARSPTRCPRTLNGPSSTSTTRRNSPSCTSSCPPTMSRTTTRRSASSTAQSSSSGR